MQAQYGLGRPRNRTRRRLSVREPCPRLCAWHRKTVRARTDLRSGYPEAPTDEDVPPLVAPGEQATVILEVPIVPGIPPSALRPAPLPEPPLARREARMADLLGRLDPHPQGREGRLGHEHAAGALGPPGPAPNAGWTRPEPEHRPNPRTRRPEPRSQGSVRGPGGPPGPFGARPPCPTHGSAPRGPVGAPRTWRGATGDHPSGRVDEGSRCHCPACSGRLA